MGSSPIRTTMTDRKKIYVCSLDLDKGPVEFEEFYKRTKDFTKKFTSDFNSMPHNLKEGYKIIDEFEIEIETEYEYGDTHSSFKAKLFRLETDSEYERRKKREDTARKTLLSNKRKAEYIKKKLMKDPDYKKFLELKEKFKK